MYFWSLDLITDDHARPVEELEVGGAGDQSEGLRAIEQDLELSGASSPIDTEATHTNPGSRSGNLGPTLGLDIYDDLADNPSEYQSSPN
jgi:hypothetical protein